MKKKIADNLARFFYDSAKLSLAILVLGLVTRRPFPFRLLGCGIVLTLLFLAVGVILDLIPTKED